MHKQGDVVVYVESGLETNALVVTTTSQPSHETGVVEEFLTLLTIPQHTQGVQNLTPITHGYFARTLFGVRAIVDGIATGWKDGIANPDPEAVASIKAGYSAALTASSKPVVEHGPATGRGITAARVVLDPQPYYQGRPSGMHAIETQLPENKDAVVLGSTLHAGIVPPAAIGKGASPEGVEVGEDVCVQEGTEWLHARVAQVNDEGGIEVAFDDGSTKWVGASALKTRELEEKDREHEASFAAMAAKPDPETPVHPPEQATEHTDEHAADTSHA